MGHDFFTDDLLKQLKKTSKSHSKFTNENNALKSKFRTCINPPTLGTIVSVVCKFGYKDEQKKIKAFSQKVESGNFDDVDIELFKNIIESYKSQIMNELENVDVPNEINDNGL